mmetsp:Transcript_18348/g.52532  ORF Transcript_18348/g.52532 Transcript_18348/m.52532 type:complete len:213 (+) Transcript_18348:4454-5092(+)
MAEDEGGAERSGAVVTMDKPRPPPPSPPTPVLVALLWWFGVVRPRSGVPSAEASRAVNCTAPPFPARLPGLMVETDAPPPPAAVCMWALEWRALEFNWWWWWCMAAVTAAGDSDARPAAERYGTVGGRLLVLVPLAPPVVVVMGRPMALTAVLLLTAAVLLLAVARPTEVPTVVGVDRPDARAEVVLLGFVFKMFKLFCTSMLFTGGPPAAA